MMDVDPNEIENISVLKDASATAVFGVRGADGVILITSKRGKLSKLYRSQFRWRLLIETCGGSELR